MHAHRAPVRVERLAQPAALHAAVLIRPVGRAPQLLAIGELRRVETGQVEALDRPRVGHLWLGLSPGVGGRAGGAE